MALVPANHQLPVPHSLIKEQSAPSLALVTVCSTKPQHQNHHNRNPLYPPPHPNHQTNPPARHHGPHKPRPANHPRYAPHPPHLPTPTNPVSPERIQNTLHDLYTALLQTTTPTPNPTTLSSTLTTLTSSLHSIHEITSTSPHPSPGVPETLIHYVENGRNPDIYTREFVELVRRMNQLMRGKMGGFRQFRDVLAREMEGAMPEVRGDVERVLGGTGGR